MKIQLVPFGEVPKEVIIAISEGLKSSFGILSEIAEPKGLPKEFYNPYRHQYVAPQMLDFLEKTFKGMILAVTNQDLFAEDLNFVFGQAQVNGRTAIISICRIDPTFYGQSKNKKLLVERAVKESIHEVGHMAFGLKHCQDPNCVMSFSGTIFDVDRKSKDLCESCQL